MKTTTYSAAIPLAITLILALVVLSLPGAAATTSVDIIKYASDRTTVVNRTTVTATWMESNLPVQGDGKTEYYLQGPVFINDQVPSQEEEYRWNRAENVNVLENSVGAVRGTALSDLVALVGGMGPGDRVNVEGAGETVQSFSYGNVMAPNPRQGTIVLAWFCAGVGYVPGYEEGMRLVFFPDTSVNPWGLPIFGNWDWHESAEDDQWVFHVQGYERYPETTSLAVEEVSRIVIYSRQEPPATLHITSDPPGAEVFLNGAPTGRLCPTSFEGLGAGDYTVTVLLKGYVPPVNKTVVLFLNSFENVHFALNSGDIPAIVINGTPPQSRIAMARNQTSSLGGDGGGRGEVLVPVLPGPDATLPGKENISEVTLGNNSTEQTESPGMVAMLQEIVDSAVGTLFSVIERARGTGLSQNETVTNESGEGMYTCDDQVGCGMTVSPLTSDLISLTVLSNPPGASIKLNGTDTGFVTPGVISLNSTGEYLLGLVVTGYLPLEEVVEVNGSQTLSLILTQVITKPTLPVTVKATSNQTPVAMTLPTQQSQGSFQNTRVTPDTSVHSGTLYLTSYPSDAIVTVNGKSIISHTPALISSIREGLATIRVEKTVKTDDGENAKSKYLQIYSDAVMAGHIDIEELENLEKITISSTTYNGLSFTLDGKYPQYRIPTQVDAKNEKSFVALMKGDAFFSFSIPATIQTGGTFEVKPYTDILHRVLIDSNPQGAEVFINGFRTGYQTPFLVPNLSVGPHLISVSKIGFYPQFDTLLVPQSDERDLKEPVKFFLEQYAAGDLLVDSRERGATITLNGLDSGEVTPHTFRKIPAGVYEVRLTGKTFSGKRRIATQDKTVEPGGLTKCIIDLNLVKD
ncbi:MAG: PEGA domain-containing protein [Methanomicrobiales archaeon]|nr:PEGA domain-containing protein [Methanomicrobiales archaeon]